MKSRRIRKALRRSSLALNTLGTISLIMSLIVALFPQGGALAIAQAGSGAIWTTLDSCGTEQQDTNQYAIGDHVFINGSGFDPGVTYAWNISGQPGGASGDPGDVVASGTVTPDPYGDGSFCFDAYTIQTDDWGTYSVKVANKGDNYRVSAASPGSITVVKTADPTSVPETGGEVTFTITVNNTDAGVSFTLQSLIDDVFGNLDGVGTCSVPQTIAPLGSYVCSFTTTVSGEAGASHVNTVTGSGIDAGGFALSQSDSATVGFTDALPAITVVKTAIPSSVIEPGGNVTFSIAVTNTVGEELTLNSLVDDVYGDLNGLGSCDLPQTLSPAGEVGDAYTCSFSAPVNGQPIDTHTNTVSASATDNEQNQATDNDSAVVTIDDILPQITIVKTANPVVVPETGGDVTYSLTVTNLSAEALSLTSLVDDVYGDLDGIGTCDVPQTLEASGEIGDAYSCSFTVTVSGTPGETVVDVITASASDDDGNSAQALDDASVTIQDVEPNVSIEKTANPTTVPETGADVTFTLTVTNTGAVGITVLSLVDTEFGDLNGVGNCLLPQTLAPLAEYTCSFMETISGVAGDTHSNTVAVTAEDLEGTQVGDEDSATVEITDVLPDITVEKTADPILVSEVGEDVTFSIVVTNTASIPVTLDSLVDDIFGDLNGQGTCSVPQSLAASGEPGDGYGCEFTAFVSGEPGVPHINNLTASASDADDNSAQAFDDATVTFSDVLPAISVSKTADPTEVSELGGDVTFTITVTNLSAEELTLTSLVDSAFGDLNGQGTCSVPQVLAANGDAGDSYTCEITAYLSGEPVDTHTNIVTATAEDNDSNTDEDQDDSVVSFIDVLPVIDVVKSADPTVVPETGGDVTYSLTVTNLSDEAITLDSLSDDLYGDLDGRGTCLVPQVLAPNGETGDSYSCQFTESVSGAAGDTVVDLITAQASDNDDNNTEDNDDATVTIQDVIPDITVEKSAEPGAVIESGGEVTFTITVTNSGSVDMTLLSLVDDVFGDLDGVGDCSVPQNLAPLAEYSCSFTQIVSGEVGVPHVNTVTGTGADIDENQVTDEDDATVEFIDVLPDISVDKTPSVSSVVTPGANVTFTVTITNLASEAIEIVSLVDSEFGDLNGVGTCSVPQTLEASGESGDSYVCSFTAYISGDAGATHNNVVTANGFDSEQNEATDADDATVRILRGGTPPLIPVTGIDLGGGFPLSSLGFVSMGLVFFGLGIVTNGYAHRHERKHR